jgi:cell wall-associated NlpC family hydrolase
VSSPDETRQAADLIERLLTDAAFRAEFRRDPASACERFGLSELASELRGGGSAKALYTLELRQSMSSLAGVIMAAAAEGIGALDLAGFGSSPDKRVAGVVNEALSRHSIKAISQAQLPAAHRHAAAAAGHGHHDDHPQEDHRRRAAHEHEREQAKHPRPHHDDGHGHGHDRGHVAHDAHAKHGAQPQAAHHDSLAATPAAAPPEDHREPAAPAPPHEEPHPTHEDPHAGHEHGGGGELAAAGAPVPASAELHALLENPNLELPGPARADLASGRVDPRLVSVLTALTKEHKIELSVVITGHDQYTSGGSVSNHFVGRGLDIASVDGEIVRASSIKSRELAEALTDLPESIKPTEVGTPWPIDAPGFFTDGAHQDHLHIAFDDAAPASFQSPVAPAAPAAPAAAAAAAAPEQAAGPGEGRASGVFAAAAASGAEARGATVGAMPAVEQQPPPGQPAAAAQPAEAPAAPVEPSAPAEVSLPDVSDVYPGDDAPKEQIAAWMARQAHKAGLPGELPIMASLVESRLSNINYGDADSVGYFQMRTSIWDQGEYAGYGEKPELQLKWFIDHALHEKQKRIARGEIAFLKDSSKWGDWVADVERPAEQYRGRYQLRLGEARELLGQAQASAPAPPPDATLDAVTAGAELDAAPQAKKALAIAKEYLGTPYQWGGATPETNFDCSGLMQWSYKQVGIDIPRVTYDQVNVGEKIPKVDALEAGDLVFFQDSSGDMHHVGMYIGEHKFIHAPHTGDVVKISSLDESYYQEQFAGGRRMAAAVPEAAAPAQVAAAPAAPAAPVAAQMPAPEPESRQSGVFAAPAAAVDGRAQTVGAIPAAEQPQQQPAAAAAVEAVVAAPAAPVPGAPVAPVAPEDMANTNEGGKLHASEFHVHDAEGAPGAEGNLHAGYDLFARPGAAVHSPIDGTVVEVKASRGNTGQIFGGVVKVQDADGRVWVFRHVDPKGVVEGGKVTAGQEIAGVTEWAGGSSHAHIELWKTLQGGYNVANMDDPYVELQKAYAGGGGAVALPPEPAEPVGHDHEGHDHDHGGGGELAAAGPAGSASPQLEALLANPNLELPGAARADLASGRVDPRLVAVLSELTNEHKIKLSVIITGHDKYSSSGSVSNHFVGRGLDIASVDGEIVRASSIKSRELAEALTDLPESIKPTEVGTPWPIDAPGFFTDGAHQDHLHLAFDDPPPADFAAPAPVAPAAAPVAPAATPVAEAAAVPAPETPAAPAESVPAAAESGVFQAASEQAAASSGNTVQFMQAVKAEVKDKLQAAPEPDLEPAKLDAQIEVAATAGGYPGDNAPKEQLAAWMASRAREAGIPPELPVMAALVESRLSNINFGDADSIGFFQMRTSIWDQGEYAGYGQDPEKQIKWFLDHAVHEKEKRVAAGYTNFLTDETKWGDWVADVERPAEQYRGRYQERLEEARALLGGSGPAV